MLSKFSNNSLSPIKYHFLRLLLLSEIYKCIRDWIIVLDNVNPKILNPVNSWSDKELYINTAKKLADMFKNNFNEYGSKVEHLKQFGPKI